MIKSRFWSKNIKRGKKQEKPTCATYSLSVTEQELAYILWSEGQKQIGLVVYIMLPGDPGSWEQETLKSQTSKEEIE